MPKRHLGQNFLYDPLLLRKIVDSAALTPEDTVVEIGPGPGRMTKILTEAAGRVIAIELDGDLYNRLRVEMADISNLELVHADALEYPYETVGPFKVVANIPYYITTPIIFRMLEAKANLRSMTLTIQKEVAERIVASPGGHDYGILSIAVQYFCRAEMKFIVRRESFRPVPRVDSAVVHIKVREQPAASVSDEKFFFRVVRTAFGQRRKTIANTLRGLAPGIRDVLLQCGIDPMRRPETLSLEEFALLSAALSKK
ncbi:MAG: 16S rRNA (adenine(1518)-N(6)/adenine(1519)-N(6)) -dimethyltransferase RsmA [Thermodesulfovibrionales bacterium]